MKSFLTLLFCLSVLTGFAQENLTYQVPPKEILELVDVPVAPQVLMDESKENMVLLYRDSYKSIEDLSKEEMRLGGLRIDPKTNIGSRVTFYNNVKLQKTSGKDAKVMEVTGLPANPKLTNFRWSPDETKIALTNTTSAGTEVWVLDIAAASVTKVTEAQVNANMRNAINWFEDGEALLVKMISKDRQPLINTQTAIPKGPRVSVNDGKKSQNRTYQDLLKNKDDEHNFEQLALSELYKVSLDGTKEKWLASDMYGSVSFSPDGNYVLVTTIDKPFSYLVPYYRFPSTTTVYNKDGQKVETVLEVPLIEDLPKGFMAERKGKRDFQWRRDKPSTLCYIVALDEGDPENEVEFRDEMFELEAPFNGAGRSMLKTINRFSGIKWGTDELAVASDYWWDTRNTKAYLFNPSDNAQEPVVLSDRNYQDQYSDPGRFIMKRNEMGSNVLNIVNNQLFAIGSGYTPEGQFPFVDKLSLKNLKKKRIYQSTYTDKFESIYSYDPENNQLLVR
ncbi:MAG: S9 family peptidase, partial [Bacteroidota bacterium]